MRSLMRKFQRHGGIYTTVPHCIISLCLFCFRLSNLKQSSIKFGPHRAIVRNSREPSY
jgi:hypothetical protein